MPKFYQENCKIKDIFIKHGYSERFIDKCVRTPLNKLFSPIIVIEAAEKKQVTIASRYMGISQLKLKSIYIPACDLSDIQNFLMPEELFQL